MIRETSQTLSFAPSKKYIYTFEINAHSLYSFPPAHSATSAPTLLAGRRQRSQGRGSRKRPHPQASQIRFAKAPLTRQMASGGSLTH